ncbi:MAG: hypothetical protein GOVbin7759_58 [Prokaryotic dsDNA virus sp.]|jgi:RimJ/RimL family protein N-acetyltransferase|nr:MAG: hypothetical protein GOVbin7759_58 [Prokaryotic dsDNA virus sp.]|tara:strand:- start:1576 stop:1989 length:414 start_codon:yes stop_codon:yes gene_type:complete
MAITLASGDRVAQFVSDRLGMALCPPFTALGLERDGVLIGGALFNSFEGADVHVTVAGRGWTRGFLRAVGHYVFEQIGCCRMTFTSEHRPVIKYACRLGGQIEGALRDHYGPGRDGVIVGVLRREWKFGKDGASKRG